MGQNQTDMDYSKNKRILQDFYSENGILEHFGKDNKYLESAFHEINEMWLQNLEQIKEVRYLMIAEAPLWGKDKSYIYNPKAKNTSFFYKSYLESVLDIQISDKQDFIKCCNEIGLLIVDISPFALNFDNTVINYGKDKSHSRKLDDTGYRRLIEHTISIFFEKKLELFATKKCLNIKVFFRYDRVKKIFQGRISEILANNQIVHLGYEIPKISKRGGVIDKSKFHEIINQL